MFKDAKTAFVLLVAFFSIGLTPAVLANGPELQIIGENQEELQPYQGLDYFCTPAAQSPTINALQKQPTLPWQSSRGDMPNLGFTNQHCWFRFAVRNQNPRHSDWELLVDYAMLGELHLYQLDAGGNLISHYQAGMDRDFAVRPGNYPTPAFPLSLPSGKDSTFYLKVTSPHSIQLPIRLLTHEQFARSAQNQTIIQGIFFGGMLVMILYNLSLFFSIREKVYLLYVCWSAVVTLFLAVLHGYAHRYLWPHSPLVSQYIIH